MVGAGRACAAVRDIGRTTLRRDTCVRCFELALGYSPSGAEKAGSSTICRSFDAGAALRPLCLLSRGTLSSRAGHLSDANRHLHSDRRFATKTTMGCGGHGRKPNRGAAEQYGLELPGP